MVKRNGSNIKTSKEANYLQITYANANHYNDELTVTFKLRNNPIVAKWIERLTAAQKNYNIDDPYRFTGFGNYNAQVDLVINEINQCIDTINSHNNIINRKMYLGFTQDDLNFLHHIFEIYHGLLDNQTNEFFVSASKKVQTALANLNVLVHKAEGIMRGAKPRHVVTYFGLPKTKKLEITDYDFFTDVYKFGSVYLNYVEIGKTLEDLAYDQDQYISAEAFKPFSFYSADFCVMFYDSDMDQVLQRRQIMKDYYNQHKDFFYQRNLDCNHPTLRPGRIPLADIDSHGQDVLQLLEYRQFVKSVKLI